MLERDLGGTKFGRSVSRLHTTSLGMLFYSEFYRDLADIFTDILSHLTPLAVSMCFGGWATWWAEGLVR